MKMTPKINLKGCAGDRVGNGRVLHVGQVEKLDEEEIYGSPCSLVTSPLNTGKFEYTYRPYFTALGNRGSSVRSRNWFDFVYREEKLN
jgi:hypothetical protein